MNKLNLVKKNLNKVFALSISVIFASLVLIQGGSVHAAGDAYFTLSPDSTTHTVGDSVVLSISETSGSSDNTNAVQANLSYPTSLLQFVSINLSGPFSLCGQKSGGGGAVNIGCASTTATSGNQAVAQITFTAISNGSASVSMTSGSDIDNTSGSSVWNGVLPSTTYTLNPVTTGGGGGGGGGGSGGNGGSGSGSGSTGGTTKSSSNTTTKSSTNSTPTTTPTTSASTTTTNGGAVNLVQSPKSNNKVASTLNSKAKSDNASLASKIAGFSILPIVLIVAAWYLLMFKGYRYSFKSSWPFVKIYKKDSTLVEAASETKATVVETEE